MAGKKCIGLYNFGKLPFGKTSTLLEDNIDMTPESLNSGARVDVHY
jgi:hypothetical protein